MDQLEKNPLLGEGQVDLWIFDAHIGHGQETNAYVVDKKVTDRWA
jgi:hypothetical protein